MTHHTRIAQGGSLLLIGFVVACNRAPRTAEEQGARGPSDTMATVTAADIRQSPAGDPIQLLMARSPGVSVSRSASGGIVVRVRGGSSVSGNNDPLYIVDGSPFQPAQDGTLTGLNPSDIATIRVLKNPADLSMYGARGANGVIVIKTKKSKQ